MTTGVGPYVVPDPVDIDPSPNVLDTTFVLSEQMVDIGGVTALAETLDGRIPGPTLRVGAGDTVIVRLVNHMHHPSGLHWHGVELANSSDGQPFVQNEVPGHGTYLYKFIARRPGIYWYHPHHHHPTNRTFRGTYGMIVVADPHEPALIASGVIPGAAQTQQLVLSDITVCKAVGGNDAVTYDPALPWLGPSTAQPPPTPRDLCELAPLAEDGTAAAGPFAAGRVPNIQRAGTGQTNEGQTILTNGFRVGGRAGTPTSPGAPAADARTLTVSPGQGLRLQIANCATVRYFRLLLTDSLGQTLPLVRIGGEGGLLDQARVEGGVTPSGYDTKYAQGEILLPPASRADVVVAIPAGATGVATLWTQDFQRAGSGAAGWANLPTQPVMHLDVSGPPVTPAYTIADGTALRASIAGAAVETLPAATGNLLDPTTFVPPKPGLASPTIRFTGNGAMGVDGIHGAHGHGGPYTAEPHLDSSRYAKVGDVLQLSVRNTTEAHHPFHLHGFSMQPISLTRPTFPAFNWPYREFRDNIDIPGGHTLTFRVRIEDRPQLDGVSAGGALGRWMFHCHIFFHAHQGMTSELVVTAPDGSEKPNVDVNGSWAYTPAGGIAKRTGRFHHPDGDAVALSASIGTVSVTGAGTWEWELDSTGLPDQVRYVYITGTDVGGRSDQAAFRLKIGAPDDGADAGDPHIHTVDGDRYDFQAAGEFVLLRDDEGMEVQARQWPVPTADPVTDPHSGLKACVSVNTAVAARVGRHAIAYQPGPQGEGLQLYVDGKPAPLPEKALHLDGHRVSTFDAGAGPGLRVDYAHHAVLTVTPYFWSSHALWGLNVAVAHTYGEEGIMAPIPPGTWLPRLSSGATVGPMPRSLEERYRRLYVTFADSWRVTDETSLFVYAPGTSTATFTDREWPAVEPPCELEPRFRTPGMSAPAGIEIDDAREICKLVTDEGLNQDCVFDVATTGDPIFAEAHLASQRLKRRGTAVQVVAAGDPLRVTATVLPLTGDGPPPAGAVAFHVDGAGAGGPVELDAHGRAVLDPEHLGPGAREVQATFVPGDGDTHDPSTSPVVRDATAGEPAHDHDHDHDDDHSHHDHHHRPWWLLLLLLVIVVVLYLLLS